jgi:acetoin utilization protein AcuB
MKEDLPSEMLVKAWMNPPEYSVKSNTLVDEAFATMKRERIRHLLVVDEDELVGVVTDRDLRRPDAPDGNVMSVQDMYLLGRDMKVADVMSTAVQTAGPDDLTAHAAKLMVENKINCLPVVRDGEVVGILTSDDLLAALVYSVDPEFVAARDADSD